MRIACIRVPSFAVAVERRANLAFTSRPLVVIDRKTVLDASAGVAGIQPGLSAKRVKDLCPHASLIEADHNRYRDVFNAMLEGLERVVPQVESVGLGCAYADVRGLHGHYENEFGLAATLVETVREVTGLLPSVGIAEGKFVAWVAASSADSGEAGIVPHGQEAKFLHDKEIGVLPFEPELVQRLDTFALRKLGDIAALSLQAVEAQFGKMIGGRLWELARGIDCEPLRPRKTQELITESLAFDTPTVATEALLATGKLIVSRLVRRLKGRMARRMHLQLLADERIVWERVETFREPTGDERRMLLLLKTRISSLELPQAVDTARTTLSGISQEVAKQAKLFTDTQNLNQIGQAIRQLRARYGRDMVGRVMEVDPWSRHPEERNVLVPYDI